MSTQVLYEDIEKESSNIKPIKVYGGVYTEINNRIKAFRKVFPTGYIETEAEKTSNGFLLFRAHVGYYENEKKHELAVSVAKEKEDEYTENSETIAIGKALGLAGFGIDVNIMSAEEKLHAIKFEKNKNKEYKKSESSNIEFSKLNPNIFAFNVLKIVMIFACFIFRYSFSIFAIGFIIGAVTYELSKFYGKLRNIYYEKSTSKKCILFKITPKKMEIILIFVGLVLINSHGNMITFGFLIGNFMDLLFKFGVKIVNKILKLKAMTENKNYI